MAITYRQPFVYQDIVDAVAANYHEYSTLLEPDQTGLPINLHPAGEIFFGDFAAGLFIAMICPPNMTLRDASIGPFIRIPPGSISEGVSSRIASGQPIFASDTFQDFTSAVYASAGDAVNDINVQIDAYIAANPTVLILGTLVTSYEENPTSFMATAKLAGKTMPP